MSKNETLMIDEQLMDLYHQAAEHEGPDSQLDDVILQAAAAEIGHAAKKNKRASRWLWQSSVAASLVVCAILSVWLWQQEEFEQFVVETSDLSLGDLSNHPAKSELQQKKQHDAKPNLKLELEKSQASQLRSKQKVAEHQDVSLRQEETKIKVGAKDSSAEALTQQAKLGKDKAVLADGLDERNVARADDNTPSTVVELLNAKESVAKQDLSEKQSQDRLKAEQEQQALLEQLQKLIQAEQWQKAETLLKGILKEHPQIKVKEELKQAIKTKTPLSSVQLKGK